jgi:diguanylate cyclase (GGDEF)-like protein
MRIRSVLTTGSVRGGILLGFGVLIAMLAIIIGGAVITVREYQDATSEMQKRATLTSEIQTADLNGSVAAMVLQRFVLAGEPTMVTEFQLSAGAAVQALDRATTIAAETDTPSSGTYETLSEISTNSRDLVTGAQAVIEARQNGQIDVASAEIEKIVPQFRAYRLQLTDLANMELAEVDRLKERSHNAGNLALTLLIVSGVVGSLLAISVAIVVARSIIRPLSKLEETALAVALGDMRARAPVNGPRELKRLAESLNLMTSTAHQRTEELRLSNEELRQRNRQLLDARYKAATDPLTGLLNHRTFHERIKDVVAERLQDGGSASLIMIDIDNFKRVNDMLGHMAGDHVLREISATIAEVVGDHAAYRYGGDEFAILLPEAGRSEAFSVADRILKSVKTRVRSEDSEKATISLGVACFPDWASSAEELLYRADMALNWAKSRGKCRVAGWDQIADLSSGATVAVGHRPAA